MLRITLKKLIIPRSLSVNAIVIKTLILCLREKKVIIFFLYLLYWFFGRDTQNLRKVHTISSLFEKNEAFLKDKINELEEKFVEWEKKI